MCSNLHLRPFTLAEARMSRWPTLNCGIAFCHTLTPTTSGYGLVGGGELSSVCGSLTNVRHLGRLTINVSADTVIYGSSQLTVIHAVIWFEYKHTSKHPKCTSVVLFNDHKVGLGMMILPNYTANQPHLGQGGPRLEHSLERVRVHLFHQLPLSHVHDAGVSV